MNKKKLIAMIACLVLIVAIAVGGSLAYFMDVDSKDNVFTVGDVTIDLWEDFGDNDDEGIEELIPATGSAQNGTLKNGVEKEVYVTNTGTEDAYVRVHIAIPQILDNGDPTFDAGQNVLHFNYTDESVEEGKWNWTADVDGVTGKDGWNFYTTQINGVWYNVYVVTYETALSTDDETVDAMHQVYLDSKVTNSDITDIKGKIGDEWHIHVIAEGAQKAGFENAYEALNTAFGKPGEYTVKWDASTYAGSANDKTFADK